MVKSVKCEFCECEIEGALKKLVDKYKIPFYCKYCGSLSFRYSAIRDIVFIWPDAMKERIGSIIIPDIARTNTEYGVVITAGKGSHDKLGKKFVPCTIKTGDYVVYDISVPWNIDILGTDGRMYQVKYMGAQDVKGIVVENET
ncbi:MAG TPA: hypothetical protein VMV86_04400 [Methanosarcinales archaeon]|nr:hypothetical protein [Methanosarcinales archaeon]